MNSLHSSVQRRSPVRGVALRPSDGVDAEALKFRAASPSLAALDSAERETSVLRLALQATLKATRETVQSSAKKAFAFVVALFAMANIANAATFFRIGGGAWNSAANWSATSGGPGGAGVPGIADVAIFDLATGSVSISFGGGVVPVGRVVVQSGITVTLSNALASTLQINGITGDALNAPLTVAPNATLFVGSNTTLVIANNLGAAPQNARIFGTIGVGTTGFLGPAGAISNAFASPFRIEDGGTLRMSGGTYTNTGGGTIEYASNGARGTLQYDRPDNVIQTVPAAGVNEIPQMDANPRFLGNLLIRRSVSAEVALTGGQNYNLTGTLTVENLTSVLSIPLNTTITMAASRMIAGGTIKTVNNPAMNIGLSYAELAMPPLNAATSELAFTPPAMVNTLENSIPTLNVSILSDMQIYGGAGAGLQITGVMGGGQITIGAGRRVTMRNNAAGVISNHATSRLNVNGTLILSTGSTIDNQQIAGVGTNSGIVVGAGGRIQFWGSAAQITPGAGNTFYVNATSVADYQDIDFATLAARLTTPQEIPPTMNGSITVNRLGLIGADLNMILLNAPITQNGNLNLVSGGIGMNGHRMTLNGTVTMTAGGYIAGSNMPTGSAFVYNNTANTSVRTTNSTLTIFNHFGITNTGNLTLSGQVIIDGTNYNAAYETMTNNANGQLLLNNTGNLVFNAADLRFQGANAVGAGIGQGGHIPATNTGAISGDTGSQITFEAPQARSYLRMAAGGQTLANLLLQPGASMAPDYLVSLRTPLTVTSAPALTLNGNAILQLGPGANLTLNNAVIVGGVPSPMGNFIDASQGGTLRINNMGVANYTFPIGANVGAGVASRYLPITINNTTANENYIVSVTTAIANLLPIPADLTTRSVNAQWTISKGAAAYAGPITLQWNSLDEPAPFQTSLGADPTLTSIRRWTGSSYNNVQPTASITVGNPRTIQATFNGSLSNTTFIVSNALFPIYWVGGNNTDWGNTNNWASSSNGAPGSASPPGANDWAIFDRAIDAPNIATNIPASIQRLTVLNGAAPSLVQNTALNLAQRMQAADVNTFFGESLHIGTNSTLRLAGTNLNITPTVMGNFERGIVFGTLRLDPPSTFNHTVNMPTAMFAVSSGATLQMAGGTFTKGMNTTLEYKTPSPYFIPGNPNPGIITTVPATLAYAEALTTPVVTTPAATNEWGAVAPILEANLVVNRTGTNRDFFISTAATTAVTVKNNVSILSGRFNLLSNQVLTVGPPPTTQNSAVTATANGTFIGNGSTLTELIINGQGPHNPRFAGDNDIERRLGRLTINNALAQVTLASNRNLTLLAANGLNVVAADNSFGLRIANNDTLTLYRDVTGGVITSGRVQVDGRLRLAGETLPPFPSINNAMANGLVIGTNGTLDLVSVGLGAITNNAVVYLAPTSTLRYGGQRTVSTSPLEFPHQFGGTLIMDKGFSRGGVLPGIVDNLVQVDADKTITGAAVQLLNGALDLSVAGVRFTSFAPINAPSPLGMFRTGFVPSDACIEYNNPAPMTLRLDASGGAPFLGCLTITNATVTMAPGTSATFEAATAILDAGRLFLDGTANLQMNGNSLSYTGNAMVGGFIRSASGVLTGAATSNLTFTSPRQSVLRMAGGAGNQLNNMTVNSAMPLVQNPLLIITTATVVNGTLTMNGTSALPTVGGGNIRLEPNVTFNVNATNASYTPIANNNFIETALGSRLIMPIAAGAWRNFPVGTTNTLGSQILYSPVAIRNSSAASDFYSVNASHLLTNQSQTYPQRVNVQWTVNKNSGSTVGDQMQYLWEVSHEASGFVRANGFVGRWNGSSYDNLFNSSLGGASQVGAGTGSNYYSAINATPITSYSNTPFVVLNPPVAIILAADSLSINGSGGFNPPTPNGFASPGAGNLSITSGTPFTLRISSFNGLNQRSPVLTAINVQAHLWATPGGTAIFNTTGTGSVGTPMTLNLPGNPISATTTNITFDWLNPGNAASTTAILRLYDPSGTLTTASLTVTVLAPPLRPSTIAYTQIQNSSNGTLGFNGGGLGQFNITGGVSFPINFGLYSNSNFLAPTTATTQFIATVEPIPGVTFPGASLVATPADPQAPTTATLVAGTSVGSLRPIVNWTNPPGGTGITKALLRLSWLAGGEAGTPQLGSTTVTIVISTSSTTPVPTRLGYAVVSGDLLDANRGVSGFNGGNITTDAPIISQQQFRVNFASFIEYGAVARPTSPTQVQMSISAVTPGANFTIDGTTATTISQLDGTGSVFPRITWTNPPPGVNFATAQVTLTAVSGQTTLIATTAQVVVFTTGSIAVVTSFNPSSSTGTLGINGGNLNIPSGRPFNIDFAFFNPYNVLATGAGNPMQLSVVGVVPATETVTIDGNSVVPLIFGARQARMENVILNWRNPTVAGPIAVTVQLTPVSPPLQYVGLLPTQATIILSTGSSIPVALAFSQISSTGTQGINNGVPVIASGSPFNVNLGLFDAFGVLANSLSNSSVALTVQPVVTGQTFTVSGATGGVFVNQSAITLNGVSVTWTNPNAPTTQVLLVVSTTAGAGPIASTSAIVTISASSVFPAIAGFSPAFGGPGSTILINGINFTGVNAVSFNGTFATNFTVLGDNLISVVVPAGATSGPITVSRPAGMGYPAGSGTSTTPFTVGTPPSISSISPTTGGTGTRIVIRGTNLGSLQDFVSVNIAGLAGTIEEVNANGTEMVVRLTGTSLTPLIGPVTLATLNGVGVSAQLFTYNLPPIITGVTPSSAVVNGQDIPIVITGSNFNINLNPGPNAPPAGVYFSLVNSPQSISPAARISIQSVTPTEIRATISGTFNNAVGQRFIIVLNNDGQQSSIPFQLVPGSMPTLTSITPNTTSASGVAFIATITGTNFFGALGTTVTANGTPLTLVSASSTELRVVIPPSLNTLPATLTIVVRNSDGSQVSGILNITDPGRPVISSITPARAVVGSSDLTVTLIGSGFFLNAEVTFNNIPLQVLNNPARTTTQIVTVIPANLMTSFGNFLIRVTNPGGFSGASVFQVGYPAPTISSVLTASGAVQGQPVTAASVFPFQLAITGTGFRQGLSVSFNNVNLQIVSTSDTQVIVQVPAGLNRTGVFPITLTNADGLFATTNFVIGTPNAPVIRSVSPSVTNATATPFIITINGENFGVSPQGQPQAGFQVRYNGTALQIIAASPTQVVAFVPAGVNSQEGNAIVQVVNPDTQTGQTTVTVLCSVCPIISGFSPGTVRQQYPFDVTFTIEGSNFQQGATITLGGQQLRIVSVSGNRIVAVAPAGFFFAPGAVLRVVNPDGRAFTAQTGLTVSVREVMNVEQMSAAVYPNPMEDFVTFEANLPKSGQLRVRVTDVLGNAVILYTQAVGSGRFTQQLDVSALSTGVYFFEVTDGERRFVEKLIKR